MSRRRPLPSAPVTAEIESLEVDGRGVARVDGKVVFIDGALPDERVRFLYTRRRGRFDEGRVSEILRASPERVTPRCPHFGTCGGCALQHLDPEAQRAFKQAGLLERLRHIGDVEPRELAAPLTGPSWGYRAKARLGVRFVVKKDRLLVGFRERRSGLLADLSRCEVLHPSVGEELEGLRALVGSLSACRDIPQVEVAVGEDASALILRHLAPLSEDDRARLAAFQAEHGLRLLLQPGGPETVAPLLVGTPEVLAYTLPAHDVAIEFRPDDFTQVNPHVNRAMVDQAIAWLSPEAHERILDLYCGLGNFSLPLARRCARVVGLEGEAGLVRRARENAARNGLEDRVEFRVADLNHPAGLADAPGPFDKLLLDPPRSGALEVVTALGAPYPRRVVYVSCNPATLARDAGELVHRHAYRLARAGVLDMFPHTAHVESMALFTRD